MEALSYRAQHNASYESLRTRGFFLIEERLVPIDECKHTFEILATSVLPGYFASLQKAFEAPHAAADFGKSKLGVQAILRGMGRTQDFSGAYVFLENSKAIYVGISRGVITRIRQHLTGKTHYDATLAFRMAQLASPKIEGVRQRKLLMKNAGFLRYFEEKKKHLSTLSVAFVEVTNPVELYLFEVYAAMALDTGQWNSFRTH